MDFLLNQRKRANPLRIGSDYTKHLFFVENLFAMEWRPNLRKNSPLLCDARAIQ